MRAAVVGVGYLGRFHAQKIKALPGVELVGVCDFVPTQAESVAHELQVKSFPQPKDLIGNVDYVHIAASTQSHYELAKLFLSHKIPVLVEKPIAATVQQAEELCELADKNKTLLSVGHIERFNPAFLFLRKQSLSVRYLEINRLAPFRSRGSDVSVLHDLTIHDIDLVHWLIGADYSRFEVSAVRMIRPTIDDVSIRLFYEDGRQVTINNSRISPQIVRNYRAVSPVQTIFVNTATLEAEVLKPLGAEPFHEIEKSQLAKTDALADEASHFARAVRGEIPPVITAAEATAALRAVESFIAAVRGV
jgi:predicted dehydrogenase